MASISVYGYDFELLDNSKSFEFYNNCEEPHKAEEPQISLQRGCPFLNLPYELRAHIYSYVLPKTLYHASRGVIWLRATAAIWVANRQMYNECISLMYGIPTFSIDVRYDKIEFFYQWALPPTTLVPKRIFNYPDPIAPRNRPLMRKFHVCVHEVDSYTGMVKYNYSHPEILARGLRCQVASLCALLENVHEIRELQICYTGGDAGSHAHLPIVTEPFWHMKNTKKVTVLDPLRSNEGLRSKLQLHLTDAYTRNSFMRLPVELREHVYRHILPHTLSTGIGHKKVITCHSGDISILCTSRQINVEATRVLYDTNESDFSWMLNLPFGA